MKIKIGLVQQFLIIVIIGLSVINPIIFSQRQLDNSNDSQIPIAVNSETIPNEIENNPIITNIRTELINKTSNWEISNYQLHTNETIYVYENITIKAGGHLVLNLSNIYFSGNETHFLKINPSGKLSVYNSRITTNENYTTEWVLQSTTADVLVINSTFIDMGVIRGAEDQRGIWIHNSELSINNLTISNSITGLTINKSSGFSIINLTVQQSDNEAIDIRYCNSFSMTDISFTNTQFGLTIDDSNDIEITKLSMNLLDNTGITLNNVTDIIFDDFDLPNPNDNFVITVEDSHNVQFSNGTVNAGIEVTDSSNILITKTNVLDQNAGQEDYGIRFIRVEDAIVQYSTIGGLEIGNNAVGGQAYALAIENGQNITIKSSHIRSFRGWGLVIKEPKDIIVCGNTIEEGNSPIYYTAEEDWSEEIDGGIGIYISSGSGKESIYNNTISDLPLGIYFDNSSSQKDIDFSNTYFYLNNFENTQNYDPSNIVTTTFWYSSAKKVGNYWNDYSGIDSDNDSLIDTPYELAPSVKDQYPLVYPNYVPIINYELSHNWFIANAAANGIAQNITWSITDDDAKTYSISLNETTINSGLLNDTRELVTNISQVEGIHYYKCVITDLWSNTKSLTVKITVEPPDVSAPALEIPANITLYEVEPMKEFVWNCTEDHPDDYTITLDDSSRSDELSKGNWNPGSPGNLTFQLGNLYEGNYTLNITMWDILKNESVYTIPVYVIDEGPVIYGQKEMNGSQDSLVDIYWRIYDAELNDTELFVVYQNGTKIDENSSSTVTVTNTYYKYLPLKRIGLQIRVRFNTTSLEVSLSNYEFNITVVCEDGLWNSSVTIVHVIDTIPPEINPYENNTDQLTETQISTFSWIASDTNPNYYNISLYYYDNETRFYLYNFTSWSSGNHTYIHFDNGSRITTTYNSTHNSINISYVFDAKNWPVGDYHFEVTVVDIGNNSATSPGGVFSIVDNTSITVYDLPFNMTLEYDDNPPLVFNFTDANPTTYRITVNGTIVERDDWNGTAIVFNATDYLWDENTSLDQRLGYYEINVLVRDRGDHQANHTVGILVQDTTKPRIINEVETNTTLPYPNNQTTTYHRSKNDHFLFVVEEKLPDHYYLLINNIIIKEGKYNDSLTFDYSLFPIGDSFVVIVLTDLGNNTEIYYFTLTMIDPVAPIIKERQNNYTLTYPQNRLSLEWQVFDVRPSEFKLYINNTLVDSSYWEERIYLSIGLPIGQNDVLLEISDTSGNKTYDHFSITVLDVSSPVILHYRPLARLVIYENETLSFYILAKDEDPDSYKVIINSQSLLTGTWTNKQEINFSLTNFPVGDTEVKVIIYDASGNNVSVVFPLKVLSISDITTIVAPNTPSDIWEKSIKVIAFLSMPIIITKGIKKLRRKLKKKKVKEELTTIIPETEDNG